MPKISFHRSSGRLDQQDMTFCVSEQTDPTGQRDAVTREGLRWFISFENDREWLPLHHVHDSDNSHGNGSLLIGLVVFTSFICSNKLVDDALAPA